MKIKTLLIIILMLLFNMTALGMPRSFHTIVMPGNIQFQIADPNGNITGYDYITGNIVQSIPDTIYVLQNDPDENAFTTKDNSHHVLEPTGYNSRGAIAGIYKVKIFGATTPENLHFFFNMFYQNIKGAQIIINYKSIIYPNVTWTYEITVPDVPPATKNVLLVKVANPQDLIIDINAAGQLNYIGNPKFVSEITKEINEIEAEKAKGKVDDGLTPAQKAKKEYTELLKEITEKYNKPEADEFVKQEAYTVLKEDLEYIISHL